MRIAGHNCLFIPVSQLNQRTAHEIHFFTKIEICLPHIDTRHCSNQVVSRTCRVLLSTDFNTCFINQILLKVEIGSFKSRINVKIRLVSHSRHFLGYFQDSCGDTFRNNPFVGNHHYMRLIEIEICLVGVIQIPFNIGRNNILNVTLTERLFDFASCHDFSFSAFK